MKVIRSLWGLVVLALFSCQPGDAQVSDSIIFKDSLGHILSQADLAATTGQVNYEIMNNHPINTAAKQLHEEARVLGQSGQYDESIRKLEAAMDLEPTWAYPVYDLAFTYLLKGDSAKALQFYQKTDELQPKGFFTTKTALYTLEGEKAGKFPSGLYMAYMQIEWTQDANEKFQIARTITDHVPDFAPAWKELANLLDDNTQRLNVIDTGLSKAPDAETQGVLLINKAIILDDSGKKEEAKKILGDLIFSAATTTANVELAKFALKSIAENKQ